MLRNGRIVASGPPEDVLCPDLVREVFGVRADPLRHPVTGRLWLAFSPEGNDSLPIGNGSLPDDGLNLRTEC